MVATWNPAASAGYYARQTGYYAQSGGVEPRGRWYARSGAFGLCDSAEVDQDQFARLFAGRNADGREIPSSGGSRLDRVPAFDVTLSAPRSVSLLWSLADDRTRAAIEAAHSAAVRETLQLLEREAAFARRGRNGNRIEPVRLSAACFRHSDSRPAEHADGITFADPNLHTHCVILNLAERADGSIGALHSTVLRDWKMAAGAAYHAALAAGLRTAGFDIDRIGSNGIFEVAGVDETAIRYFSARRQEIVDELAKAGLESHAAVALAASIAKVTRGAKTSVDDRRATWNEAARRIGFDATEAASGRHRSLETSLGQPGGVLAARLAELPRRLTENHSVLGRQDLFRAVAEAFVGTGIGAEGIETEVTRLLENGQFIAIGRDRLGLPHYSTPEMVRIEREVVEFATGLTRSGSFEIDRYALTAAGRRRGLSAEQMVAVRRITAPDRLAVVEGAPGTGKTTLLAPAVQAWKAAGLRVIGTATAWRMANTLRHDLAIESRATASWLARAAGGMPFLDKSTVLVVDEAGLLASREMHALLSQAHSTGAKVVLLGDRNQLQAIGAGSGLRLVTLAAEAAKVQTIVRQHESWARDAITAFGHGDAAAALEAFAKHGLLVESESLTSAVRSVVDRAQDALLGRSAESVLLIARSNAEVAAIGAEVRSRLRNTGLISGRDVEIDAVTPSGHGSRLSLAKGDRIRFLTRNDALGVINGTVATVTDVEAMEGGAATSRHAMIEARIGENIIRFNTTDIADEHGRSRIAWAYASTVYGAQGLTVDRAAVLLTPEFDRHEIYVAASRARGETTLVVDRRRIDLAMQAPPSTVADDDTTRRRRWLAERLSIAHVKDTTFDFATTNDLLLSADRSAARRLQEVSFDL